MRFTAIVARNLRQRPARTLLTIVGVAVGVAAVVALASLARGFEQAWVRVYTARGTDLIVTRSGSLSPVPPAFPREQVAGVASIDGVTATSGMLSDVVSIEDSPIVLLFGWQPGTFVWDHLTLISGRWPAAGEHAVVIGKIAQEVLRKTVGSTVRIETGTFTVAGVFESGSLAENGAVVMTLAELERLTGQDGKINFLNVKLSPSVAAADAERLRLGIPGRFPGFRAFTATEVAEHNAAIHAVRAMSWAVTAIALVIGTVGVMNTMLMSVFERVREFGILLAIGWRRRRVVAMILSEAVAVAMAGGLVGIACGMAAVRLLERAPWLRGKIEGDFSLSLAGLGLALALVLGVAGGLYPAWRGARMKPSDALRYE